ncbi:unnamed protein product [Tilletia laevis]|uniref:C3H1-type domain-containing protein n=3 Tax=Tilletia TaxID=13289 RepID=A0A8X7SYA3_9BASI|nr:hypothetical protein CF328_g5477 [Tilletia controversa]KAE8195215.1 hypothetical protein CF335_g5146 [Tilletia laevis]KAE8256904.1 hypothetical protein A4X03_0g4939 [Tilletia caries]KAE8197170.1 hypothetical protein CF336_g2273 [Tilletia laevis]KAE8250073.1 hypothetical protein A4X06_0g2932 [Tilletia controversa]
MTVITDASSGPNSSATPASPSMPQDEQNLPLCSAYLLQLFHSPIFLTAQGHNATVSHHRILAILADPSTDQDDRIDAVRSQFESCLRLNPNSNTSSANAARRSSGGNVPAGVSSSPTSSTANGDTKIPDEHLDDLVLELMHRHQQDCAKFEGSGSAETSKPVQRSAAFRPPRPQPQAAVGSRIGGSSGVGRRPSDLSKTLPPGSATSSLGGRPSSSSGLHSSLAAGISGIALAPGSSTSSPRPWTPSGGGTVQSGVFGAGSGQGNADTFASSSSIGAIGSTSFGPTASGPSSHSPFGSPGSSPRLWTRGLPLPLGDAAGGIFRSSATVQPNSTSTTSSFVPNPWSSPPAFSLSTPNSNSAAFAYHGADADPDLPTAADLQRTSSDLGGEPTSPNSSTRAPSAGGIGRTPGAPGSGAISGSTASSNAQPFARIATTNAAAKAAAAAAAAVASKSTAIGSERDADFRPRWGSISSSAGNSERRPSDVEEDARGSEIETGPTFNLQNTDGQTSPEKRSTLGSAALGGDSPSPKRGADGASVRPLTASSSSTSTATISAGGSAPGSNRASQPTSPEAGGAGDTTSLTPALSSTTAATPVTAKAASVSSTASTTASPRLNVAAAEFKPRVLSPHGASGQAVSGPGTPPRFGNGAGEAVPVPGAEAGGAAWYGYALAAAAATSSSSTPSSSGVGAGTGNSSGPSGGGGLLSSSPGSAGIGQAGGTASPPVSPSPSHAYARSSVRPTPLRKQVGTDDDEEDDEYHSESMGDTVQYATYPTDAYGMQVGYGAAAPPPSSSHGSTTSQGPGRKSHEREEDEEDDDEFSPFGTSKPFARGGGAGGYGHPGSVGPGMASSLVARMMAGTGSPLGPSRSRGPGSASGSPISFGHAAGMYQGEGYEYGTSPMEYGGSPGQHGWHRGPPPHTASPRGGAGAGHLQYLQGQLPSTGGGGGSQDVFSSSYQPHSGGMYAEDGYGGGDGSAGPGDGVSDAEFNELEAAIEAEEAERRRANMTPFDVLYSILNGTGENSIAGPDGGVGAGGGGEGGGGSRKTGTRWTPKQIETALSRNGWDVEATLNWIMAGGMNTVQQGQAPGPAGAATSEGSSAKAGQEGASGSNPPSTSAPNATQGPLSSSLSSSASSSLSSSAGTGAANSVSGVSTSATSATPRAGSTGSMNGNTGAGGKSTAVEGGAVSAGPTPPSTSLPHFVHHYIPGSTKPGGFASPRAMFSVGQSGNGGNGSNMARSGSGASGSASGTGANTGSGSGGAGSATTSFRPISYSNGVAVLPREAFQSHKGGVAASSGGGTGASGAGNAASGARSPRIGSPSLFHMNIATAGGSGGAPGPLTPSHFGGGSSPLPSPGLNGPTTPGGSGGTARVCRYFLAGECRRFDCRFSHDLGRALCRFWLRGQCLNDPCGFLHDYDVVNKLARGMKSSLSPSAGSTPGEMSGGDGYFAQRPGGGGSVAGSVGVGDALGSPGGLGGGRWTPSGASGGKEGLGGNWATSRSGSSSYRDRANQDGSVASPGTLDFRGLPSQFGRTGGSSGGQQGATSGMMAVPDADAPDEFPVLSRPSGRDDGGKKAGASRGGGGGGGGPRWVLASSGAR